MACLVFLDNDGRQIVHPLEKDRVSIGRGNDNDIVSLDLRVSRHHASITRQPQGFSIQDDGSSMGLFVNHRRVTESALKDGDIIRVGDSLYSFVDLPAAPLEGVLERTASSPRAASDAGLRGSAMVAELQDALLSLRHTVGKPGADPHILAQCFSLVDTRLESLRQNLVRVERGRMMMQTLYEVGKVINSSYDRGDLLEIVLDLAVKVVCAERGFLTLYDAASDAFSRRAAINMGDGAGPQGATPPGSVREFSTGIALSVARSGRPVVTTDAQEDERFREMKSVVDLNIRSALCVPLVDRRGAVMGVIYVDTRAAVVTFAREDQEFLMAFANYASIAIENATLFAEVAAKARMEEELRQARRMDEEKSDLISMVSHDVRTPLTSIKSFAEILYDDYQSLEPARIRHYLDVINREADRLSRLVTNYLDLQKIDAGMMRLTAHPLEVAGLIEESLEAFEGAAQEKGITLTRELEASLPAVRGDRDRLLQVLANLVSNALKFTPPGGSVIMLARASVLPGRGPAVQIDVCDTGEGIPEDKLDRLFRRFSQVGEGKRGTGLGLVFSREIVELHGGRIDVTSVPAKGSTFHVVLPVDGP
ncbi:MAG TPA: ATP-binding protein [Patescibacteria group bacterium]|nr:ATP-binding protein [Patescibacteria group bacterium]